MPQRRLDDRIRQLCTEIASASNAEMEEVLQELLGAIHEKVERLRTLAVNQLLVGKTYEERRAADPRRTSCNEFSS